MSVLLTGDEVSDIYLGSKRPDTNHAPPYMKDFARAIQLALLEKLRREPVAWMKGNGFPAHISYVQSLTEQRLFGPMKHLFLIPSAQELALDEISALGQEIQPEDYK